MSLKELIIEKSKTGFARFFYKDAHEIKNLELLEYNSSFFSLLNYKNKIDFTISESKKNVVNTFLIPYFFDSINMLEIISSLEEDQEEIEFSKGFEYLEIYLHVYFRLCGEKEFFVLIDYDVPKQHVESKHIFYNNLRNTHVGTHALIINKEEIIYQKGPVMGIVWKIEEGWPVEYVSDNVEQILGYTKEEVMNSKWLFSEYVHPDDIQRIGEELRDYLGNCTTNYVQNYRILKKNGDYIWIRDYSQPEWYENRLVRIKGYIYDISVEIETQELLTEQIHKYKNIMQAMNAGTWEWDILSGELVVNDYWAKMLGYELEELIPMTYKTWERFVHKNDLINANKLLQEHLDGDIPYYDIVYRMKHHNGHWIWIHDRGRIMRRTKDNKPWIMTGVQTDITEYKQTESMLRQAEKLTAIGRLAGGIAHDINNQLMMIQGYLDIMLENEDIIRDRENLINIEQIVSRSAGIVRQLLTFSKLRKVEATVVNMNELIGNIGKMMIHTLGKSIKVECRYHPVDIYAFLDTSLVENAIVNLCINARDAMEDRGILNLNVEKIILTKPIHTIIGNLVEGNYIVVKVIDNGRGISENLLEHIFEPFFTTKETGNGIGLSTVIGMIKQHSGGIAVTSNVGKGTEFKLYFPEVMACPLKVENPRNEMTSRKKCKHILLVDDEEVLSSVLKLFLESKGFTVTSFTDPRQVIEYYKYHWQEIDVAILDMIMPYLSGFELFIKLLNINTNIQVLYLSGYSEGFEISPRYSDNVLGFKEKPVKLKEIYEILLNY